MASPMSKSGPDLAGAVVGSCTAFIVFAVFLWFGIYACFRMVLGNEVVDFRSARIISSQYLLAHANLSLPQHRVGIWPGVPSWSQIDRYYGRFPTAMRAIKVSTWTGVAGGSFIAAWVFILLMQPRKREVRVGGTRLVSRAKDFARIFDDAPDGIWLHPKVRLSRGRESCHINLVGATGTGKTQVINYIMQSAKSEGDALMVFDFKGDLTAKFFQKGVALLAPWDARGWALAVGRDVTNKEHARTLAEALIPDAGTEGIWASAARIVTTAAICGCIQEKSGHWTFTDLLSQLTKGDEELNHLVHRFAPEGVRLVKDMRSRTTQSILITLAAHLSPVESLAMAWAAVPEERTLSISQWIRTGIPQTVILQGNGEMRPLSAALNSMVFRVLLASVAAPSLSNSGERRRWFFGDEFLQFGKVQELVPLLQVARSKGIRFVLAAQDVPGIRSVYGTDGGDAVLASAATVVITGTNCSVTSEWASKKAGTETIERLEVSRSYSREGASDTERWTEVSRPVLTPENLTARLGQFRQGKGMVTRALVIGARSAVGLLDWPRLELPDIAASHEPAAWLTRPSAAARSEDPPSEPSTQTPAALIPCTGQEGRALPDKDNPPRRRLIVRKKGE